MSNAKQESDALTLAHGTTLQIGQTKLLCHIHDGHVTCGQCEPGLLQGDTKSFADDSVASSQALLNVTESHKRQLKNLKKRYGLQDDSKLPLRYILVGLIETESFIFFRLFPLEYLAQKVEYKNDRAEQRRQVVGSSCDHEKTKTASVNT